MEFEHEEAMKTAEEIVNNLRDLVGKIEICGSLRRKKQKVHDIDIVLVPRIFSQVIMSRLLTNGFAKLNRMGTKIISGDRLGIPFDIYISNSEAFETLVLIRTGSKEHNIKLCRKAREKGWKLKASGDGLIDSDGNLIDNTEKGILEKLLGENVPPERRD